MEITCCECGTGIEEGGELYTTNDGRTICNDCYEDNYFRCEDCGEICGLIEENSVNVHRGHRLVCENCAENYVRCDDCGKLCDENYTHTDNEGHVICDGCWRMYVRCHHCGTIVYLNDAYEWRDEAHCGSCYDDHIQNDEPIHPWDYEPAFHYLGASGSRGYYGVELEIDGLAGVWQSCRDDCAQEILDATDEVYMKNDGSLHNGGFEIVTHPATLEYHMHHMPWSEITEIARSNGFRSHSTETCGLHVHASRSLFGSNSLEQDLTIAKIMLIFDTFWDSHIVPFSRRDIEKIDHWAKKPNAAITPHDTSDNVRDKVRWVRNEGRYQAINLENYNTVEFRIFRGTLARDTIIASIQLVDTLIDFATKMPLCDFVSIKWQDIFSRCEYSELRAYLQRKHLDDGIPCYNIGE